MTNLSPLVVLDADSTTLQDEVIELLAKEAGTLEEVSRITEQAMRGEIDFVESLRERVRSLRGTPVTVFESVVKHVRITDGLLDLVRFVHAEKGIIGVVSGGFHEILDTVLPDCGIDIWTANRLVIIDEQLTGELYGPIIDAEAKAETLRHWSTLTGIPLERSFAVGDGANDLLMMDVAGASVAFNAKPIVRERADFVIDGNSLAPIRTIIRDSLTRTL